MSHAMTAAAGVQWEPRLLVIDDDPHAHDLVDYYLSKDVSVMLHAESGVAGVAMARDLHPDAILLDIEMPGVDGFEVCRQLKEQDGTRAIPVLFLTRDRDSFHVAKALDLGGFDYVTKPFVPIELQARVRAALRSKLASDILANEAHTDPLTQLANRRAFDEALQMSIADYERNRQPFALLLLDIDHFKKVNDTYGHGVGDEVLVHVGRTLRRECRPYDRAARYGGEEFALILNRTGRPQAFTIGQRLLEHIRLVRVSVNDREIRTTVSAGLASTPDSGDPIAARQLIDQADAALYQAKAGGRDRMVECTRALPD